MTTRENHLVELVDDAGRTRGETTVSAAHQPPGQLHRAFSVLLVDPDGRVLLQRRASVKTRFPLRWANSCCGHPAPGESLVEAANRRLREELGAGPVELTEVGVYAYYAEDPATSRVEFEYDHVLRGEFRPDSPLLPDPAEVAELRWVDPVTLVADLDADPRAYAPWLGGVVNRLLRPSGPTVGPSKPAVTPSGPPANDAAERSGGR
ncbi:isopentenyl-diphosphate Delta-isomerase [Micromonospora peucetia]|uniref:Isopentenyl-diphosphate Delta-isomerase n=1 Tax=Micromonospora peucetia TaxID=47871 RepID=A0A1C6USB8_9ACTN|nr:isopentenyl-diphosphate Delta-isomerase [Micromonospora peucetia]WSA34742.1 isopentenyl-diphosphate Delta-isomerase [Micromonospora peucetia]SCL56967.1 isopentenyl-diphosphate delta-isomerase [Micromonospora peucetia]